MIKFMVVGLILMVSGGLLSAIELTNDEKILLGQINFEIDTAKRLKEIFKKDFTKSQTTFLIFDSGTNRYNETTKLNNAIVFEFDQSRFDFYIKTYYNDFKSKGYLLFRSEMNFGISNKSDRMTILRSTDQFDILLTAQTDGANYDIDNAAVIKKLTEWNAKYPFFIVGAGLDWMDARFIKKPHPMLEFAKEVYQFCPDVVDQGTNTVLELAKEMSRRNTLYLWWD